MSVEKKTNRTLTTTNRFVFLLPQVWKLVR